MRSIVSCECYIPAFNGRGGLGVDPAAASFSLTVGDVLLGRRSPLGPSILRRDAHLPCFFYYRIVLRSKITPYAAQIKLQPLVCPLCNARLLSLMPGHWGCLSHCLGGDACSCPSKTPSTPVARVTRLCKIILTRLPKEKMKLDVACRPGAIAFLISTPGRAAAGIYPGTVLPKRRRRGRCSPLPCPNAVVIVSSASFRRPLPHSHLSGHSCPDHLPPSDSALPPVAPLLPFVPLVPPRLLATTLA